MPTEYAWLEPVLIAAVIVFVIDSIGNIIEFNNRFVNALVTAVLFAVIFGFLVYLGYGRIEVSTTPVATPPAQTSPTAPPTSQ
jgi:hypothetical protein